uniref:Auxin response factor n=1 Tax=Rhizophora mucronata TaxID=61149 RepID=A0A2P2MPY8_RHIMU
MLKTLLLEIALTASIRLLWFNCSPLKTENLAPRLPCAALRNPSLSSPSSPLRKSTASPETSFFLFTNALHPVVSKCLRG